MLLVREKLVDLLTKKRRNYFAFKYMSGRFNGFERTPYKPPASRVRDWDEALHKIKLRIAFGANQVSRIRDN
jgi:hypothetical protein